MKKIVVTDIVFSALSVLINRRFLMIALMIMAIPFIVYGAKNSWGTTENRVEDWVPSRFVETRQLREFGKIFGANEILLISWDTCTLDCPQLTEFKSKLLSPQLVKDGSKKVLYSSVITGKDVYDMLANEQLNLDDEQIFERLKGFLLSQDYSKTCLLAIISKDGAIYRPDAVNSVWKIAESIKGIDMKTFHAAGPTMDSVAIDKISRTYLIEMNVLSYMIGIFLSYLCFKNLRAALIVFAVSFLNQQICLALIYWLNIQFDSILMLSVNLTFVLSMSAGIHLTNYYRDAITRYEPREAVLMALKTALVPTFISVITTIAGLLSFLSSQLIPIRKFGMLSSSALAISVTVILIYLPIHYIMFPVKSWQNPQKAKNSGWDISTIIERMFCPWVSKAPYLVLAVSLSIVVICFWGAKNLRTSIGLHSMLRSYTQPIQDYTWMENQFGPMIPVEVMLSWTEGHDTHLFDHLLTVKRVSEKIKQELPDVGVISITNFMPDIPESGTRIAAFRRVFNRKIDSAKQGFEKSGFFKEENGRQYWRITVRTFAMRRMDYGPIIQKIKEVVKQQSGDNCAELKVAQTNENINTELYPSIRTACNNSCNTNIHLASQSERGNQVAQINQAVQPEKPCISICASGTDTDLISVSADIPIVAEDNLNIPLSTDTPAGSTVSDDNPFQTESEHETHASSPFSEELKKESKTEQNPKSETPENSSADNSNFNSEIKIDDNLDTSAIIVDENIVPDDNIIPTEQSVNPPLDNSPENQPNPVSTSADQHGEAPQTIAPDSSVEYLVTGGVPVVYKAQQQLLADLQMSFLTAFGIIALILICLFQSFRCGILAVYPSLLPVIFVFGIVGWLGTRVEMGTMLTGSAALGIAVDNTVHFITWFRIGHQRGLNRKESVQLAYRKCGAAMFQTSSVCSLGLVTYMASPFIPTIYFSFFMCALLFSALISDLTVMPAILLSAWGGIFLRSLKK